MKRKKGVTEEDVKATEAMILGSFMGLKRAVLDIPSEAAKPVTDTVRKHPFLSVAASAGAGFLLFQLISALKPRTKVIIKETGGQREFEEPKRRSLLSKIISRSATLAVPYVTSYVQSEIANMLSGTKRGRTAEEEPENINVPDVR